MVVLRWGATTDPGRVRTENEDTFVAEPMLFAVADGMGGHQAGEVASALAASILRDRLGGGAISEDAAAAAVGEVNTAIYGAAKANPAQSGMGTTLTAIAVLTEDNPDGEERLVLFNVGDSRTYRFRAGRLQRVTVDHSYVQELVAAGHISIEEARTHPRRNIVTRALGIEPMVRTDMWTLPIVRGDRYVLASDGLVDEVPDNEILDLVASTEDPQELTRHLVDIANRHGGRDNVTVVVVDVIEGADPPDPTDEMQFDPSWAEGVQEPTAWADDFAPPVAATIDSADMPEDEMGPAATVRDIAAVPTMPPPPDIADQPVPDDVKQAGDGSPTAAPPPPDDAALAPREPAGATTAATLHSESDAETLTMNDSEAGVGRDADGAATAVDGAAIRPALPTAGAGVATAAPSGGMKIDDAAKEAVAPPVPKRRRFTAGVFLFAFLIAAILTVTFTLIAAHARSGYFVGFEGDTVVVYKGQRDNVLWFSPTVDVRSAKTRAELAPEVIAAIDAQPTFDSADEAADFIEAEVIPTTTTVVPETTTTTSTPVAEMIPGETSTTAIQGP